MALLLSGAKAKKINERLVSNRRKSGVCIIGPRVVFKMINQCLFKALPR